MSPDQRKVHLLGWLNLMVFAIAFLPGIVERGYPRPVGLYLQIAASVILIASSAYWAVLLGRIRRAEGQANRVEYREAAPK